MKDNIGIYIDKCYNVPHSVDEAREMAAKMFEECKNDYYSDFFKGFYDEDLAEAIIYDNSVQQELIKKAWHEFYDNCIEELLEEHFQYFEITT